MELNIYTDKDKDPEAQKQIEEFLSDINSLGDEVTLKQFMVVALARGIKVCLEVK